MFENPQWKAENPDRWESYHRKSSHSIHMAFSAIASGVTIQSRYSIKPFDWPSETPTEDESFPTIISELRKQFNYLRSYPPKKRIADLLKELSWGTIDSISEGLTEGTLRNVFLYLDGNAAASVLENQLADEIGSGLSTQTTWYQGYLRVRLQQLINNFHVARRWHADKISMEDLWKAAQKEPHNGSFVSMEDEEIFSQDSTWEVATAVRPRNARLGASD
ncbi:uncharacterized protein N7443_006957 [Penicillium atrosanguineum]|uniref:uncharacterized protein n=1 Tax=Penicillium atrosanguineum TaxID=1132637 RepID=UPI00239DFA57|nr:uncharacterized protein N7443_006957 [Penicillium atrosanguineum]KAJ5298837.1 hypothetical protein N7443_006957 [Penicillium atrosanguineum]